MKRLSRHRGTSVNGHVAEMARSTEIPSNHGNVELTFPASFNLTPTASYAIMVA